MIARRRFTQGAVAASAAALMSGPARALDFPTRPLRWIDDTAPGGSGDIVARLFAQRLSEQLGQAVIVDNRPGGSGIVGLDAVLKSPADGYTLFVVNTAHPTLKLLKPDTTIDFTRDFAMVSGLASGPLTMLAHPSLPAATLPAFIDYAKANPGKVNFGSVGNGSPPHLAAELFKAMAGVDLTHVPYRGGALALTDLLAGHVQTMFTNLPTRDYVKQGSLRALAVTTPTRSPTMADIPAIAEVVPGYSADVWFGAGARSGTSPQIIEQLSRGIEIAFADPTVLSGLAALDATPLKLSASELSAKIAVESAKWTDIFARAKIVVE